MRKWENTGWTLQYSDFQDLHAGGPAGCSVTHCRTQRPHSSPPERKAGRAPGLGFKTTARNRAPLIPNCTHRNLESHCFGLKKPAWNNEMR